MQSISWSDISKRDDDGKSVVNPQRLAKILEDFRRGIENLEDRLIDAENKISDLEK